MSTRAALPRETRIASIGPADYDHADRYSFE